MFWIHVMCYYLVLACMFIQVCVLSQPLSCLWLDSCQRLYDIDSCLDLIVVYVVTYVITARNWGFLEPQSASYKTLTLKTPSVSVKQTSPDIKVCQSESSEFWRMHRTPSLCASCNYSQRQRIRTYYTNLARKEIINTSLPFGNQGIWSKQ